MKHFVIIIFPMCWLDIVKSASDMTLDPTLLSKKLVEFIDDSVHKQEIQNYVWEKLRFGSRDLDSSAQTQLHNLAGIFSNRLQESVIAVQRLRDAVLKAYGNNNRSYLSCCNVSNMEYDEKFQQMVALDKTCDSIAPHASPNPWRMSTDFQDACIKNMEEMSALKWQYFGSNQGVETSYPASEWCGNDYDHRVRPWYTQGYIPDTKLVMIVIDKSSSMRTLYKGVRLISYAKAAAKSIVETLNPYDMFSTLAFSNRPETWRSMHGNDRCYSEELALATPHNQEKITEYIDSVIAVGGSYYVRALERAFQFLHHQYEAHLNHERGPAPMSIMHFISDGHSDDSKEKVIQSLINGNLKINNSLVLMTYGVGNGKFELLKDMSNSCKLGKFTKVSNANEIRKQMASIYETLSNEVERNPEPVFTVPYFDVGGLGQVITALLPVFVHDKFVGVAAVDSTISDLLAESHHYKPNRFSYSFVMSSRGMLFNHPLFPYVSSDLSVYMTATAVERDEEFFSVYESMKRGESGSKTFIATRFLPHGLSKWHGVKKRRIESTYYWTRIPNTTISVCLVIATNSTKSVITPQGYLSPGSMLFHRLDLVPPKSRCIHLNNAGSTDQTSVFLPSRAFHYSDYHAFNDFSKEDADKLIGYIENRLPNTIGLKEGIKAEIFATQFVDTLWTKEKNGSMLYKQLLWRFLGTPSGVFRVYPGIQLPVEFDPVYRPWYQRALSMPEKLIIVSHPYIDAGSGYPVITVSSAIHQSRETDVNNAEYEKIFAVVGADILLQYFNHIFLEMYPICKEKTRFKCTIMDQAGFIILMDEHLSLEENSKVSYVEHIAHVEPQITNVLIKNGVLERINCSNIAEGSLQRTYQVKDRQTVFWGTFGKGFFDLLYFKFIPVPKSNVYIIIRSLTDSACVGSFFCHCSLGENHRNRDEHEIATKEFQEGVQLVHNYIEKHAEEIAEPLKLATDQNTMIFVKSENISQNDKNETLTKIGKINLTNKTAIENLKNTTTPEVFEKAKDGHFEEIEYDQSDFEVDEEPPSELDLDDFEYGSERCVTLWEDASCECPCVTDNPMYNPCLNEYELFSETIPPCVPETGMLYTLEEKEKKSDLSSLPKCYDISYSAFLDEEENNAILIISLSVGGLAFLVSAIVIYNHPGLIRKFVFSKKNETGKVLSQAERIHESAHVADSSPDQISSCLLI